MGDPTIDDAFAALVRAKKAEADAKAARIAAEEYVITFLSVRPERGTAKIDGTHVKGVVKFGLNYKADVYGILAIEAEGLPLKKIDPYYELDEKAYEALRSSNPGLFQQVAAFVETKPAKPSIELKL